MAQDGAVTGEQERGVVPTVATEAAMTQGIHASVDLVQPARPGPPIDRIAAHAARKHLRPADGTFLARRDVRDRRIRTVRFTLTANSAVFVKLAGHCPPSMHPPALQDYVLV